ncbi:hypothetical protein EVAR_18037_1 [Eumeta japonica]|uniref:Uncharacterized protein n=1 Tax=Eumeta variegata TaxID=151549 RepID=A0A4C1XSD2_EUMVA|nr:hypothetical protein EVAR_18037_1 [Eumeta japonica]
MGAQVRLHLRGVQIKGLASLQIELLSPECDVECRDRCLKLFPSTEVWFDSIQVDDSSVDWPMIRMESSAFRYKGKKLLAVESSSAPKSETEKYWSRILKFAMLKAFKGVPGPRTPSDERVIRHVVELSYRSCRIDDAAYRKKFVARRIRLSAAATCRPCDWRSSADTLDRYVGPF